MRNNNIQTRRLFVQLLLSIILIVYPLSATASEDTAVFAGGCFWCLEHDLEDLPGVISATSGYTGGELMQPNYENHYGHQEAVFVIFDNEKISYESLLRNYWRNVDPFDGRGQFCDRGDSYRPLIFTKGDEQKSIAFLSAKQAAKELNSSLKLIKLEIQDAKKFWEAEDYHQNYAQKNPNKYRFYRFSCGRDSRLGEVWGDRAKSGEPWLNS